MQANVAAVRNAAKILRAQPPNLGLPDLPFEGVSVDLCCLEIPLPRKFPHSSKVLSIFEQMQGKTRANRDASRATALIGPRQSGKTTLARQMVPPDSPAYFDLEDPRSLARLAEPMMALAPLRGIVVIDEVQRRPDLLPILRVLARFLVLGSAGPDLLRQSSETLAGRMETITLSGFGLDELDAQQLVKSSKAGSGRGAIELHR